MTFCLRSVLRYTPLVGPFDSRLQTGHNTAGAMRPLYCFNPAANQTRRSTRLCTVSRRSCSSVAKRAADGKVRAPAMAGAAALRLPMLKLTQVSLLARPRPRSVLLCVPAPCLSSTAQPDLRVHSVGGRSLPDAAWEHTFDGCQAAARGSSMAAHRSSRRHPWCRRGVRWWPGRAVLEVRTAVGRRACCSPLAGWSTGTHCRAEVRFGPL